MILFCSNCNNVCVPKVLGDNLKYVCENCNNIENIEHEDQLTVSTLYVNQTNAKDYLKYEINEYTKLDPTLPRSSIIPCPNKECSTNKKTGGTFRETVKVRYNHEDLKYLFICAICDTVWDSL